MKQVKKNPPRKIIVIGGATASGKTDLSLSLAKNPAINGAIISADSRQIYIGMDIGTAKVASRPNCPASSEELWKIPFAVEGIDHYLIDIVNPDERYTLFDFKNQAYQIIEWLFEAGKTPIIVGGTGLYIDAVIKNYAVEAERAEDVATKKLLEDEYKVLCENIGVESAKEVFHTKLAKIDALSAARIHQNNIHAVLRALEFAELNKRSKFSSAKNSEPPFAYEMILTEIDRAELYKKIELRIDMQIEQGLIEETSKLLEKYSLDCPALSSIGYKEISEYLDGTKSLEQAILDFKQNTRNYAKRQLTWFRRYQK